MKHKNEIRDVVVGFKLLDDIKSGKVKLPSNCRDWTAWAIPRKLFLSYREICNWVFGSYRKPPRIYFPIKDPIAKMKDIFPGGKDYTRGMECAAIALTKGGSATLSHSVLIAMNSSGRVRVLDCLGTVGYQTIGDMAHQAYQEHRRKHPHDMTQRVTVTPQTDKRRNKHEVKKEQRSNMVRYCDLPYCR